MVEQSIETVIGTGVQQAEERTAHEGLAVVCPSGALCSLHHPASGW